MVSTRSKTAQTHIEDFATRNGPTSARKNTEKAPRKTQENGHDTSKSLSKKRKSSEAKQKESSSKRIKTPKSPPKKTTVTEKSKTGKIITNRALVLQLWSACVAQLTYPSLSWETCLSAGSAISTICAIAKGRSVGTISEPNTSEATQKKRDQAKKSQKELDQVEVMHFNLKLKEGLAIVDSDEKGKPANEGAR